jgi:hypothetical protein
MKKVLKYNGKVISLLPYNTLTERDILLYTSGEYDFESLMEIVKDNITFNSPHTYDELSYTEKLNILLELRNGSVGEVFSFIKKCDKCNNNYEADVSFNNVITEGKLEKFEDIELYEAFSDNYQKYVDFNIDDLDIDVYDKLIDYIDKNKTKFNFITESKCIHCGHTNHIKLTEKHLVENLSEDTLANFYQSIASMVYYGHYTKLDIDSMLPFERSIYLSIVNEEIKKANQGGL